VNCSSTGRIITHVFSAAATYTVNLVVTDSAGRTASVNKTVTVVP
jgi:PKD repeat protein